MTGEVVATCRELVGIDARTELSAGIEPRDPNAIRDESAPSYLDGE